MPLSIFALFLVVFGCTTGEFVVAGILPEVAADLAVPVPAAGLLVTAYALGMIVGGPVVTVLTAHIARKPLILGLIAVSVLGNLGSAVAPGHTVLLVARFVAGLAVATFFAVAIATAVSVAPAGGQASAVARVTLGMNLGIVLGAPLGTVVGQHLGWRATFVAIPAVVLAAVPLVLRHVPGRSTAATGSVLAELRVFADRDVQLAVALTALGNVGVVTVFTYIAPLLTGVSGFPAAAVLTFATGVLAFAIIPGMQTRVVATAGAAPTLAVAVNASGFQLAAAFAGWLGGRVVAGPGPGAIPLAGAVLTTAGLAVVLYSLRRDRRPAEVDAA